MAITHYWYYSNRVFYVHFEGELTEQDILQSESDVANKFEQVEQQEPRYIHVILDNRELTKTPPLVKLLEILNNTEARRKMGKAIRSGWVIDVGVPMKNVNMLKFQLDMIAQRNNIRYRQFETLEEAIDFLRLMDESLKALPMLERDAMTPALLKAIPSTESS